MDEVGDLRVQIDLGLHRGVAHHAPGIVDAGVGEADGVGAFGGVLAGIDVLGLDRLNPGLIGRALGLHLHGVELELEIVGVEEVVLRHDERHGDGGEQGEHDSDRAVHVKPPDWMDRPWWPVGVPMPCSTSRRLRTPFLTCADGTPSGVRDRADDDGALHGHPDG